jgi:hypothetical protein
LKTYYELLGVANDVSAEEIKRAFRKEIARYHPDKVQHLGPEFQEIAAVRAAELTEAYRVLMDEVGRQRYDESLAERGPASPSRAPSQAEPAIRREPPSPPDPAGRTSPADPPPDRQTTQERATTSDFVRKAALARLRRAIADVTDGTEATTVRGLDATFAIPSRGGLFRKSEPAIRLVAKFVPQVDAGAIAEVWPFALSAGSAGETVCVLLLGSGWASQRDLSVAIAEQRRKARKAGPVLVPVDVRDWEALFPPEAPASVRAILQHLQEGKT